KTYPFVMVKVILMNFVAIHTTTMTLASLMYEVTKHQEYIQPLREEIETVIAAEGWSEGSVRKMWKLEVLMSRKALKGFSFRNGMTIPAGSIVNVPYLPPGKCFFIPQSFGSFRFERTCSQEGEEHKHQHVTAAVDYILFGQGRHGW
ncbi:hypothetical protein M378DRAFT_86093, partial [Amanita muscaria Koide BX008]